MRLLTHNTLKNNSAEAKGNGFPLRITATEVKVEENTALSDERQIAFVKGVLPTLDWPALTQVRIRECVLKILVYEWFGENQ